MSHINQPCLTRELTHVTQVNVSCRTYELVTSRIQMSHVMYMNGSCHCALSFWKGAVGLYMPQFVYVVGFAGVFVFTYFAHLCTLHIYDAPSIYCIFTEYIYKPTTYTSVNLQMCSINCFRI